MIDDFDNIIQKLLSELPEHTPKSDVWNKINERLDEDISMSRLRKILKNTEHAPKQELWGNIESALDKIPFYKTSIFKISLSSVAIVGTTLVYLLMHSPSNDKVQLAKTDNNIIKEKPITTSVNDNKAKPLESVNTAVNQKPSVISNNAPLQSYNPPQSNTVVSADNTKSNVVADKTINKKQEEFLSNTEVDSNIQPVIEKEKKKGVASKNFIEEPKESSLNEPMQRVNPRHCSSLSDADKSNELLTESTASSSSFSASKVQAESNISIVLFAAPELSHSRYAGNSTSDINLDIKNRASADHIAFSQSYGADLKFDFNHWFIQSGINYSAVQSCSEYRIVPPSSDTVEYTLNNTTVIPAHDSAGHYIPPRYIYSWTSNKGTSSPGHVKQAVFDLKVIQIPLLAGYSISFHKLMFTVSSGISIGIPVSFTGEMITIDNSSVYNVSQLNPSLQKPDFDYLLRAGISYAYSMRYSIFIEPSYNYSLSSIFNKSYPLSQKFTTYGVRLGMLYRF